MENVFDSVGELSRRLHNREISAVELARGYLERIEAKKNLNAFLDVRPEETLKQAEAADARLSAGTAGPLTGIPIAHKDIFVTKEWSSTAASRMLKGYMSPFDATVVRQLKKPAWCAWVNSIVMNSQWVLAMKIRHSVESTIRGT